jgi:pyruvate/2-oxoglutarate dehydrogenase complex dihydrolipoamide acyltransferase (E2) component
VPVLRNVQDMDYADVEKGIAALGEKAKKNELAVEDMDGGTFTIRSVTSHPHCMTGYWLRTDQEVKE